MKRLIVLCFIFNYFSVFAQTADFIFPPTACNDERIYTENLSSDALAFEWDFCSGELDTTPTATIFQNSTSSTFKVELVEEDGQYFGFYTSRGSQKLYRLDFGTDITGNPSPVDLGTLGVAGSLLTVEIVKENSQYYGFIIDYDNKVYRFSLGTSLQNQPSDAEIILNNGLLANPADLVVLEDGTGKYGFISNSSDGNIVRLSFGGTFNSPPSGIVSTTIDVGFGGMGGLSFIREGAGWFGVVSTIGGKLVKLYFNSDLSNSTPIIELLSGLSLSSSLFGVSAVFDNNQYYIFVQSSTALYRVNLGMTMNNQPQSSASLGGFGLFSNVWALSMYKVKSNWLMLSSENSGANMYRINFQTPCFSDIQFSTEFEPIVSTILDGNFSFTLTATNEVGFKNTKQGLLIVSPIKSPDIDFTFQNICVNNDVLFNHTNESMDLVSYDWNFGDMTTSVDMNPVHQYSSSSTYSVNLKVISSNGCSNSVTKDVKIYSEPVSLFTLPTGLICTNNEFTFVNNTLDNFDGNLDYNWLVDNDSVSNERDLTYAFITGGDHDIKLQTSIPGCSDEAIQTITNVQLGPTVGFTSEGQCQLESISFTNTSAGNIAGYSWDFGNGQTSAEVNPSLAYDLPGNYTVTLETMGTNSCISTTTQVLPVYTKPSPGFQLALPPFSCSGSPSQFTDTTPNPTDSNITSWHWNFNDSGSSDNTSTLKNPTHIYMNAGNYDVSLTTSTNYGCQNSVTKSVSIAQSPQIEIVNTPACDDVPVTFSTSSQGDLKSWNWQIGNTQYITAEPVYVFSDPGSYLVNLNAIGNNNCISSTSKNVVVPMPLVPDFIVQKNCAGQPAEFTDATTILGDPITLYDWNFGDNSTGQGSPTLHTYTNTGTYSIIQSITTSSGCNYKTTKNINVGVAPTASFTPMPEVGVPPLSVTFNNTSQNANHYLWNFNDGSNSTSTEVSPQFTFLDFGDYVVDLTAYNSQNCSHTFSRVITAALPFIDVGLENLIVSENANGLLTGQVVIHNKGNFTIQNLNLAINLSGIEIRQTVSDPIPPYSSILYTLDFNIVKGDQLEYLCVEAILEGDNNLADNVLCTGVDNRIIVMSLYPNPSQGILNLDWISPEHQPVRFNIYDPLGKVIFENEVDASAGFNTASLNLEGLSQGVYFLVFRSGQVKQTQRFLIQR